MRRPYRGEILAMADQTGSGLTPEERIRLQRDVAIDHAATNAVERNVAEAQRDVAEVQNESLRDEARAATTWGAANAAGRTNAERSAVEAQSEARASTTGLFVVIGILVIAALFAIIWYANRPTNVSTVTPVATTSTPAPSSTTIVTPSPTPAPASSPVIINTPSAPAASKPSTNTTNINVTPPSMAGQSGNGAGSTSPAGNASGSATPSGGSSAGGNSAAGDGSGTGAGGTATGGGASGGSGSASGGSGSGAGM